MLFKKLPSLRTVLNDTPTRPCRATLPSPSGGRESHAFALRLAFFLSPLERIDKLKRIYVFVETGKNQK
jgi:hypothetical protein